MSFSQLNIWSWTGCLAKTRCDIPVLFTMYSLSLSIFNNDSRQWHTSLNTHCLLPENVHKTHRNVIVWCHYKLSIQVKFNSDILIISVLETCSISNFVFCKLLIVNRIFGNYLQCTDSNLKYKFVITMYNTDFTNCLKFIAVDNPVQ